VEARRGGGGGGHPPPLSLSLSLTHQRYIFFFLNESVKGRRKGAMLCDDTPCRRREYDPCALLTLTSSSPSKQNNYAPAANILVLPLWLPLGFRQKEGLL
jgi:hypothetical protein